MSFRIRAAGMRDLQPLYEMAKLTGGGFTNLPPDRKALTAKIEKSDAGFERDDDVLADDIFLLVLENIETGAVRGTCQLFCQIGQKWPFYSYRIGALTQHSEELGRTFRADRVGKDRRQARRHAGLEAVRQLAVGEVEQPERGKDRGPNVGCELVGCALRSATGLRALVLVGFGRVGIAGCGGRGHSISGTRAASGATGP